MRFGRSSCPIILQLHIRRTCHRCPVPSGSFAYALQCACCYAAVGDGQIGAGSAIAEGDNLLILVNSHIAGGIGQRELLADCAILNRKRCRADAQTCCTGRYVVFSIGQEYTRQCNRSGSLCACPALSRSRVQCDSILVKGNRWGLCRRARWRRRGSWSRLPFSPGPRCPWHSRAGNRTG